MAAFHNRSTSIHNGASFNAHLPGGPCNFRDLNCGAHAPICGCKRFWLNPTQAVVGGDERAWCFCGHHACFHNAFNHSQIQSIEPLVTVGAEQRPASTPVRLTHTNFHQSEAAPPALEPARAPSQPSGLGIRHETRNESHSINARVWDALNGFARQQDDGEMSITTSQLPSTAAPSVVGDFGQGSNRDVNSWSQNAQRMPPPISLPSGFNTRPGADDYQGSATEVATPSIAGTPDFRAFAPSGSQARISPPQPLTIETQPLIRNATSANEQVADARRMSVASQRSPPAHDRPHSMSVKEIKEMMQAYGQRIAALECISFSQVPMEDVQEQFSHFDSRLLDLEHWRAEQDQQQACRDEEAASNSKRQRMLLPSETSSFNSDTSFDGNAAMHADAAVLAAIAADAETGPRIDALETRIADLEKAALPSYSHPWQVEVVLLPWGRDLRGIWISSAEATPRSQNKPVDGPEEWSGAQQASKLSFQSSSSAAWTTESIQAWAEEAQDWLSPKACGPHGTIFQRLISRGLVRQLTLTAPDARHIMRAIRDAFQGFTGGEERSQTELSDRYHALREPFIPLRKIRKSSRLRYLSPAEMTTSSLWTAGFLDSNVCMKLQDQHRRLYITTPEAYLQPDRGQWSWTLVKHLPPFITEGGQEDAAGASSGAIEACWTHSDRLDCPPSLHTSFATNMSHQSAWSTRSQQSDGQPSGGLPNEDSGDLPSVPSAASENSQRYYLRKRTVSLPMDSSSAIEQVGVEITKRRVASFETVPTSSTSAAQFAEASRAKRRRISTSPEVERRGVYFTPRLSREPPSPFTSEATAGEARSQGASSSNRRRGNTPFAYATPHSNNFIGTMDLGEVDGDTVHDSDPEQDDHESEQNDEEWHGVEEDVEDDSDGQNIS
ncbi:hypothetical protein K431DRAFT_286098 [Polychaeton citri CBS 116435]|uniref:Uncharacterized protein n=1 Tax=Polychaeton citri CBS 116435 TaxID=1314669 RepID=A0A9P4Q7Y4_9PEZI|nr:hypothetical protein K431DRAFT_286098 [Polychaeton citri CBS 116435]